MALQGIICTVGPDLSFCLRVRPQAGSKATPYWRGRPDKMETKASSCASDRVFKSVGFDTPEDTATAGAAIRLITTAKDIIVLFIACVPFNEHSTPFEFGSNHTGSAWVYVAFLARIKRHEPVTRHLANVSSAKLSLKYLFYMFISRFFHTAHLLCKMAQSVTPA